MRFDTPGGVVGFALSPLAFPPGLCYTDDGKGEICVNADFRILGDNYITPRPQSQQTLGPFLSSGRTNICALDGSLLRRFSKKSIGKQASGNRQ